jgi:hypothetical protein
VSEEEPAVGWFANAPLGNAEGPDDDGPPVERSDEDWDGGRGPEHDEHGGALLARLRAECPSREFELRL